MDQAMKIREAWMEASSFLQQQSEAREVGFAGSGNGDGAVGGGLDESAAKSGSGVPEVNLQIDHGHVARLLLEYVLDVSGSELLLRWYDPFPREKWEAWQEVLRRKADGEPAQHIIGEQEFFGLSMEVNRHVLIPRPETELLVEAILRHGRRLWLDMEKGTNPPPNQGAPVLLDVGTGSGAIAVTCAVHEPGWRIIASDISAEALKVARRNAERHGVAWRVEFLHGDLFAPVLEAGLRINILVSNPPYIESGAIGGLQEEVRRYEPRLALDGGEDGLDVYRRMIAQLPELPVMPRLIGFEVGLGQAQLVAQMLRDIGAWPTVEIVRDLAGIERHVVAYSW